MFSLGNLRNASVWALFRMRDQIDLNPTYQREGGIWALENKQLLIDTIINGFDVPKIYMHKLSTPQMIDDREIELAVIDGKQRLSAIWDFIRGGFALGRDFVYIKDETVQAASFTYADLAREYPEVKADFDAYGLDIITIETDDPELIEDMFSRLNEAMPLNAAEKRNAWPGPLPVVVRELANHPLFAEKTPFTNRRYRHYDLAAKLLYHTSANGVADTKKVYVDNYFHATAQADRDAVQPELDRTVANLTAMSEVFIDRDPLLRSVGMMILYYLAFDRAGQMGLTAILTRPALQDFEARRRHNREIAEADIARADYDLLEFDRYTQSPNDAVALRFRLAVLDRLALGSQLNVAANPLLDS